MIAKFLESIPTGSIGLDSGCGNGKYLSLPSNRSSSLCTIGLDRSFNLLKIARKAGGVERDAVQGNALDVPWKEGIFVCSRSTTSWLFLSILNNLIQDYAISIATIHHLSTAERRRAAVQVSLEYDRFVVHSPSSSGDIEVNMSKRGQGLNLRLGDRAGLHIKTSRATE